MLRCVLCGLAIGILAACASLPEGRSAVAADELLDGSELFGAPIPMVDEVEILAVSDAMRAFVDDKARNVVVDSVRFKRLMDALTQAGYFSLNYDPSRTFTAAQVFRERSGNCLSFTNMFVALARNARLDVAYQVVDVPPIWDSGDGWLILNNHINVIVRGVRSSGATLGVGIQRDYVVDFNTADYQGSFNHRVVGDQTAFALFYANQGVEALRAGDMRTAFANFKRSLVMAPDVASSWIDLGALYSRQGRAAFAEAAFQHALLLDRQDNSALTNLARLYEQAGNVELASRYRARIQQYQNQNPYYHYTWAVSAYHDGNYNRALEQVQEAIDLKKDDHRFYFLEGLIRYRTGDVSGARSAIAKAERYSEDAAIKQRYAGKLAVLAAHSG